MKPFSIFIFIFTLKIIFESEFYLKLNELSLKYQKILQSISQVSLFFQWLLSF